jgi:hypothetical protein
MSESSKYESEYEEIFSQINEKLINPIGHLALEFYFDHFIPQFETEKVFGVVE